MLSKWGHGCHNKEAELKTNDKTYDPSNKEKMNRQEGPSIPESIAVQFAGHFEEGFDPEKGKQVFVSFINGKLNNGCSNDNVGANFLIQSMRLGYNARPPGYASEADIADWENRILNNKHLKIEVAEVSFGINSSLSRKNMDGVFITGGSFTERSLVFKNKGEKVFAIMLRCANAVGSFGKLPEANPAIESEVSITPRDDILRGDEVKFDAKITTNKPKIKFSFNYDRRFCYRKSSNMTLECGQEPNDLTIIPRQTNLKTVESSSNTVSIPLRTENHNVNNIGYSYVCTSMRLSEAPGGATLFIKKEVVVACVPVAKYPAFNVLNGDVRVGGSFKDSASGTSVSSCKLSAPISVSSKKIATARYPYGIVTHNYPEKDGRGSNTEYSAFSPGIISWFGSGGLNYSLNSSSRSLLFGSGGANKVSSFRYDPGDNGLFLRQLPGSISKKFGSKNIDQANLTLESFTSLPTHCLPDVSSTYGSSASTSFISQTSLNSSAKATVLSVGTINEDLKRNTDKNTFIYRYTLSDKYSNLSLIVGNKNQELVIPKKKRVIVEIVDGGGAAASSIILPDKRNRVVIQAAIKYEGQELINGAPAGTLFKNNYNNLSEIPEFLLVVKDSKTNPIDIMFSDGDIGDNRINESNNPKIQVVSGTITNRYGDIYTCSLGDSSVVGGGYRGVSSSVYEGSAIKLTANKCSTKLTINGQVISGGRVFPYRTYGFNKRIDKDSYAETFILSPQTILKNYDNSLKSGAITNQYIIDLPPRW